MFRRSRFVLGNSAFAKRHRPGPSQDDHGRLRARSVSLADVLEDPNPDAHRNIPQTLCNGPWALRKRYVSGFMAAFPVQPCSRVSRDLIPTPLRTIKSSEIKLLKLTGR